MKPLADRVLVEIIKEKENKSGLIIPNSAQKKDLGKVLEIGFKTKLIKKGDTVQYHENVGASIEYLGKNCLFLSEEHHIIAIL